MPFCAYCGKALGVYEPLVLIGPGSCVARTSWLQYRDEPAPGLIVHDDCYEKRQPWSEERPA